jgi:hypothetical protein
MLVAEQHRLARADGGRARDVRAHVAWLRKRVGGRDAELRAAIQASALWRARVCGTGAARPRGP